MRAANFPLPGLRDGRPTSCPIAVQRDPVRACGAQAPGREADRGSLKQANRGPTCHSAGHHRCCPHGQGGGLLRSGGARRRSLRFAGWLVTLLERKKALRDRVRRLPRETPEASRAAQERLLASGLLAGKVGLYRALPSECGTDLLASALGERACFPCVVAGQAELEFRREGGAWARGPVGVLEPGGETVPLRDIDVLVVPAMAVDLQGHRLGRGG